MKKVVLNGSNKTVAHIRTCTKLLVKTFVMDYEGYTFVFLSKYKKELFIKWDIYYAFTFQTLKILFKMQVTLIC